MLGRGPERRYNHHSCARSTTKLTEYLYNCRVEALKGNETCSACTTKLTEYL